MTETSTPDPQLSVLQRLEDYFDAVPRGSCDVEDIASVDAVPYALPFINPYVTARGRLERRELVLVRLRSDQGVEGLGEAVPLSLRGGASLATVVREIRESVGPSLIGVELDPEP